jgi:hypothetical protein
MPSDWIPVRFIDEEIEVQFNRPPMFTKKPGAPDSFLWGRLNFSIVEVLYTWFDFERRGRMARNMQPAHLREAAKRGSRGVGRFYFRVQTDKGRVFDLYYDRAPKDAADRAGHWFLWREMKSE